MSKLFLISEEEKNRILNLHESATKNHYLSEQVKKGLQGDPYEYKLENGVYYFRNVNKGETNWTKSNKDQSDTIKTQIFGNKTPEKSVSKKYDKFKFKDKELNTVTKDTFKNQYYDTILPKEVKVNLKSLEQTQKEIGKISKKTYQQLNKIRLDGQLKNDSFIIVNKDGAIASLFGPNYKFIENSSITSGKVKDVKPIDPKKIGYGEWRKESIDYSKKNPKHPDSIKINKWVETAKTLPGLIDKNGFVDENKYLEYIENKKINSFPHSYAARKSGSSNVTPGGVYKLGQGYSKKGYAASDTNNTFPLITMSGEQLPNAIHG
jgi:hypothetical protein